MFIMVMLLLIMLSNYLDRLVMTIVQEPIKLEMGLTDFQLGLITGPAFGILYGLSAIPIARLADKYDRITILSVSLAVWSGFTMLCAAVGSYAQLFVARMGVGVSEGGGAPSVYSLTSDYFGPRQRGFAIAVLGMATPLAGFIAPLVGAYVAHEYGWRWAFIAVGIPGLIMAVVFRILVRDPRKAAKKEADAAASTETAATNAEEVKAKIEDSTPSTFIEDMKWLATSKTFVAIFIATATGATVMVATLLFTASFLLRKFGLTLQEAGVVLSLGLGVGGLTGALLGGWISDRFSGAHGQSYMVVPAVGALGAGILFFFAYSVDSWEMAAALVIAATIFQTMKNGPNFAAIQTLVPARMRATASAVLLIAVTMIGSSSGPPLVGFISDLIAVGAFPEAFGQFSEQCSGPGVANLAAEVKQACNAASSEGLELALRTIAVLYIVPVVLYGMAAKTMRLKMD
ncbi:hypothetical protein BFC17_04330 [Alteromonas lipolytica]|uniref:Major facilitator superfamily (MFS) profile domain-containing protein n=1 Tax=Alteromonas lipolytica TaxID=1856405 RepID=A0A1E8FCF8_9ALTE|nr:hypothetical protein BFC17_04330 [Alteromonas lipolytica]